jgi:SAM-dependent methyltransferase
MIDDRLAREREFHDARFSGDDGSRPADRFYAINRASDQFFRDALDALPKGSRVLDYGCGEGAYAALHAAGAGHRVTAIDLSPVAIDHARRAADVTGVADSIDFKVMNAEALELEPASFDFVCGLGVIHHLDIESALREVTRVMSPTGGALFVEPLGHNPVINLYRRRTPSQRTVDEHPLVMDDLRLFHQRFWNVEETYFHLLGLLALPLRKMRNFDETVRLLDSLDRVVFRTSLRRFAWMIGLRLAGPRPAGSRDDVGTRAPGGGGSQRAVRGNLRR